MILFSRLAAALLGSGRFVSSTFFLSDMQAHKKRLGAPSDNKFTYIATPEKNRTQATAIFF
jgi:hypothetical protein